MKNFKNLLVVIILAFGIQQSDAIVFNSGTLNESIPDGSSTGISFTHNVPSGFGEITDITVTLNINGGFNGDLYAYLTHNGSTSDQTAILLNRIGNTSGGNSSSGMNVTFTLNALTAPLNIHDAPSGVSPLSGPYQADGRYVSPLDLVAIDGATSTHGLEEFIGQDPTGDWTLFVADVDANGLSTLHSWGMEITAVPEPTNIALGIFGGLFVVGQGFRIWKKKKLARA